MDNLLKTFMDLNKKLDFVWSKYLSTMKLKIKKI